MTWNSTCGNKLSVYRWMPIRAAFVTTGTANELLFQGQTVQTV